MVVSTRRKTGRADPPTAAAGHTRQDIGPEYPVVSTTLIGEERCHIVVPPAVPAGTVSLTIRKPSALTMTLDAFERTELFEEVRGANDDLPVRALAP